MGICRQGSIFSWYFLIYILRDLNQRKLNEKDLNQKVLNQRELNEKDLNREYNSPD